MTRDDIEMANIAAQVVFRNAGDLLEARHKLRLARIDVARGEQPESHDLAARELVDQRRTALHASIAALRRKLENLA